MKKFLLKLLRLVIYIAIIAVALVLFKFAYVGMAKMSFNSKDYDTAAHRYSILLTIEPKNETYKRYLAESLLKVSFTYKNQKKICDFLEKYKGTSFAYPLEQRLAKFKSDLDLKIGTNYIDKAPMNNLIIRWEDDAFPLSVYIPNIERGYGVHIKRAFDYWTTSTSNFVSFAYVNDYKKADIVVHLGNSAATNCEEETCQYVVAYTSPKIDGFGVLEQMDVNFNTSDPYGRPYSYDQIYKTALHEIGHALGIMGHSENPENLMYASGKDDNDFNRYQHALTREDLNTLNYLYMIVPHISNVPVYKHHLINKIHPSIILGTTKEIKERDISNAKKYIEAAPNLAIGYMDLGNAYLQAELYDKALKTYYTAYNLSVDEEEKYLIVYNMALTYNAMKNRDKALEFAEYARKIKPTDEVNQLIHDIKYPFAINNFEY